MERMELTQYTDDELRRLQAEITERLSRPREQRILIEVVIPQRAPWYALHINEWQVAGHVRKYVAAELGVSKDGIVTRVVANEMVDSTACTRAYEAGIAFGLKRAHEQRGVTQ